MSAIGVSWNDDPVALPRPDEHDLAEGTTLVAVVPAEGLTLYRLVDSELPTARDFEERGRVLRPSGKVSLNSSASALATGSDATKR
jgi:hypothetical protein